MAKVSATEGGSWFDRLAPEEQSEVNEIREAIRSCQLTKPITLIARVLVKELGLSVKEEQVRRWLRQG